MLRSINMGLHVLGVFTSDRDILPSEFVSYFSSTIFFNSSKSFSYRHII